MILSIFPRLTKIAVLDGFPGREAVRKALLSYCGDGGAEPVFLGERVVSIDGRDCDIVLRRRGGWTEILLRRR